MQLEISYPKETINAYDLDKIKNQLMLFHKHDKEISKAEVILKHTQLSGIPAYLCQIIISIYGNNFSINSEGNTYEEAIRNAIGETDKKIQELLLHQKDLPDEQISTVKV